MKNFKKSLCAGVIYASIAGGFLYASIANADVRVEIQRELPNETQTIVQEFHDQDSFEMWMLNRLETKGCDPYVTEINIKINNGAKL